MELQIRPAAVTDCRQVAELTVIAGGGIIEALLQNLVPLVTPVEMLASLLTTDNPTYSWRNAVIAEIDHKIAGMALAYPAISSIAHADASQLPADRIELMRPFEELRRPDSFYLSAIAAYPRFRHCGAGEILLKEITVQAARQGYHTLSLHVFEQNRHAMAFYRHFGFESADSRPCVPISGLRYSGNIILMVKSI